MGRTGHYRAYAHFYRFLNILKKCIIGIVSYGKAGSYESFE